MSDKQHDIIIEGANIISLLINTVIDVESRPRNEEDDLLMEKAEEWVDENGPISLDLTEH